jgi:DeoR/GlpR family transcriptional regulator of sugar metabolism
MPAAGRRRIVVADSTKVGVGSVARFWDATAVDVLITEETGDPTVLADLRSAGVTIETVR